MQQISDNAYAEIELSGCNPGFVVTSEGIVMIDTPMAPADAIKWRDKIAEYGSVRYLINTEPHGDHWIGNYFFKGTVVAHEGVRDAIAAGDPNQYKEQVLKTAPDLADQMAGFTYRVPEISFSKEMALHVGDHTFKLINMPGHTPYQTAVFIPEERVVFTSDNIFCRTQTYLQQAVPYEWLESLKALQEIEADVLVPGHGEICDRSYIPEMNAVVQAWIDTIENAIKDGLSVEEAQKKISGVDPYEIKGEDGPMGGQLNLINVARLYEVLQ